jgi:hypothetical protein
MSKLISEDDLDTAMAAWAHASVDDSVAPSFRVALASARRGRRWPTPRLLAALAAVAVVLGLAVLLASRSQHDRDSAAAVSAPPCPGKFLRLVDSDRHPLGSGSSALFVRPVAAMTACSYTTWRYGRLVAAVPLDRVLIARLTTHLARAPHAQRDSLDCLTFLRFTVLVARDQDGHDLAPVTLTPGCRTIMFTNGDNATRYLNVDDSALRAVEARVTAVLNQPRPARS